MISLFATLSILLFTTTVTGQTNNCPTEDALVETFNAATLRLGINDHDGAVCSMEAEHHDDEDHHDDDHDDDDHDHDHTSKNHNADHHDEEEEHGTGANCSSCENIYMLCRSVILSLNLTTEDCLEEHGHNETSSASRSTNAEAYGYGFLMILFVSLCSLLGVFLVPLINSDSRLGRQTYEYVYAFMVAIGISALISDAILHLIPHAFGLHAHDEEGDGHDHGHGAGEEESYDFIWKGCLVLLGAYAFFLLEVALHNIGDAIVKKSGDGKQHHHVGYSSEDGHYTSDITEKTKRNSDTVELAKISVGNGEPNNEVDVELDEEKTNFCTKIKPVAWLIIIGDAFHNFADGLALGAAIAQSLTLGISTMFALIFHELPHELGDYVILVKSGFHWATALIFNFLSSLTAIIGFFIGVAVSTNSAQANGWILSLTAGLFIYIAMTDLLPELIHGGKHATETKTGWRFMLRFLLINLGFFISFALLLVLAIYEEKLNELF